MNFKNTSLNNPIISLIKLNSCIINISACIVFKLMIIIPQKSSFLQCLEALILEQVIIICFCISFEFIRVQILSSANWLNKQGNTVLVSSYPL